MTLLFIHHPTTPALSAAMAAAAVVLAAMAPAAHAQTGQPSAEGALSLGEGLLLYPNAKLSVGRDDNVRAAPSGAISATTTQLATGLRLEAKRGSSVYGLSYNGMYKRYSGLSADNTDDHAFLGTGAHVFSARSRLNWSLSHQDGFDERSEAQVASPEPDSWRSNNLNAVYSYGAAGAQGRMEAGVNLSRKRYQNNLTATEGSDFDTRQLSGRYFWRVMPRTYLVGEVRTAQTDYRVVTANKNNNNSDTRLLVGATWEATAKTAGSVRIGQQKKRFDLVGKPDASSATYEASVTWRPLTYSVWTLTANRSVEDALSTGDFNQTRNLSLSWAHQWNAQLGSRVSLTDTGANYVNSPRRDDTLTSSVGLSYRLGRRSTLGLDLAHTNRDSTLAANSFKRNTVLLSLGFAL